MATRLDVQLDKSGVDQGLKQTAGEVRDVGRASKEASQSADKAGDELRELGADGKAGASEAERAVESLGTELDKTKKKADGVGGSIKGMGAGVPAVAAAVGGLVAGFQGVISVLREAGDAGNEEASIIIDRLDEIETKVKDLSGDTILTASRAINAAIDSIFPQYAEWRKNLQEVIDLNVDITEESKRSKDAEEALARFRRREASDRTRDLVEELNSIERVNEKIDEQVRILEKASESGDISADSIRVAEKRLTLLHQRKVQLTKQEKRNEEAEEKRLHQLREDSEDALHAKRTKNIQELSNLWGSLQGQIGEGFTALTDMMDKATASAQSQIDAMAGKLSESPELQELLKGKGLTQEDIAKQVGEQRKQEALSGGATEREADLARRRGHGDVMRGRASEEEMLSARDSIVKGRIGDAEAGGGLSKVTADAMRKMVDDNTATTDEMRNAATALGNAADALNGKKAKPGQDQQLATPPQTPESLEFQQSTADLGRELGAGFSQAVALTGKLQGQVADVISDVLTMKSQLKAMEGRAERASQRRRAMNNSFRQ